MAERCGMWRCRLAIWGMGWSGFGVVAWSLLAGVVPVAGWSAGRGEAADGERVSGEGRIEAPAGRSTLVITTTDRLAGAIHSLVWDGKEFIDSVDHGRQLQSACSFDCGGREPFWAEAYNPTEAGSRADGAGPRSSSRLLRLKSEGRVLETETQMAFWLAPGEDSSGRLALNDRVLSPYRVGKRIRIGYGELPQVLDYRVTFFVPEGRRHTFAQFEALTGYMPAEFEAFWRYDTQREALVALDDGPGEQGSPVVLSTATGSHAMGAYSPDQPAAGFEQAGYGRFRFEAEKVVKWNCVFRERHPERIPAGAREFRMLVAIGTRGDVEHMLLRLRREFTGAKAGQ